VELVIDDVVHLRLAHQLWSGRLLLRPGPGYSSERQLDGLAGALPGRGRGRRGRGRRPAPLPPAARCLCALPRKAVRTQLPLP
jgi:hypothetical protein